MGERRAAGADGWTDGGGMDLVRALKDEGKKSEHV